MGSVSEIAPDIYRVAVFLPEFNLEFNHFLVKDDEPLLFHAGYRHMFKEVREGIASLIDPSRIRWIGFSHFESDECGALNDWLEIAPAGRTGLHAGRHDGDRRRLRGSSGARHDGNRRAAHRQVPLPVSAHAAPAARLGCRRVVRGNAQTLFCSDLFLQTGEREPLTRDDVVGRARQALMAFEASPFAGATPYTGRTGLLLNKLAELKPSLLVTQHGSAYAGDGARALRELDGLYREVLGKPSAVGSGG